MTYLPPTYPVWRLFVYIKKKKKLYCAIVSLVLGYRHVKSCRVIIMHIYHIGITTVGTALPPNIDY